MIKEMLNLVRKIYILKELKNQIFKDFLVIQKIKQM